jgi:hypothetical protein
VSRPLDCSMSCARRDLTRREAQLAIVSGISRRHHCVRCADAQVPQSECVGTRTEKITGNPDPKHVSTSYAERANLAMRMSMRRFTRLTNAFSKKLENHAHMVALYALWYNFVRVHKSLRTSPAMAAGIETRLWSMGDVVGLIERREDFCSGALLVG